MYRVEYRRRTLKIDMNICLNVTWKKNAKKREMEGKISAEGKKRTDDTIDRTHSDVSLARYRF